MCENVAEVVRTVCRELRLRQGSGAGHTFAGVDVPTVGIWITVLVAQNAAVPPTFEKSARSRPDVCGRDKSRRCPAKVKLLRDAAAALRRQTIAPRHNKKCQAARPSRCSRT